MKPIEKIGAAIKEFGEMQDFDIHRLLQLLQTVESNHIELALFRHEIHFEYQGKMKELTDKKVSVSKAIVECDIKFPELYKVRQVMRSAERAADAMRTIISLLKAEL